MTRVVSVIVLVAVILALLLWFGAPKSSSPPIKKGLGDQLVSLIWGRVVDQNNRPMGDIIVSFNGDGVKTNQLGEYVIFIPEPGFLFVQFESEETGQKFQIADRIEQSVFVSSKSSNNYDFIIEPVD